MKGLIFAILGVGGLAVVLASVSLFAVMNYDYVLGRYPGSMRVISGRFNLLSVYKGYFSQEGVYQTDDDVMSVWRWYARHFGVEPAEGMNAEGRCLRLMEADRRAVIRRTVGVMLCSVARGTLVFVNQTVYLRP